MVNDLGSPRDAQRLQHSPFVRPGSPEKVVILYEMVFHVEGAG